jgi:hypothetical protein
MHPGTQNIINKFGKTTANDVINFARAFKEPNILKGRPTFSDWIKEYPDAGDAAKWLKNTRNPNIPKYGVPYNPFNTTGDSFNME